MMEWYWAIGLLFGLIVALMLAGMPIAMAFLAANIVGAMLFMGGTIGIVQMLNSGFGTSASNPGSVLTGAAIIFSSGLTK